MTSPGAYQTPGPGQRPRRGDWLHTWSGGQVWPFDPRPEDVRILDIAHALARDCRWNGAIIPWHYSVAQHSVLVSMEVAETRPDLALVGLLHDAAEGYLRDMARPMKIGMLEYKVLEQEWEAVIGPVFGLGDQLIRQPDVVKKADMVVCATERRDIVTPGPGKDRWAMTHVPRVERIKAWSAEQAFNEFMWWFGKLNITGGGP